MDNIIRKTENLMDKITSIIFVVAKSKMMYFCIE